MKKQSNNAMPSRVIVLASGKGGVGKSTLARALAAYWLNELSVIDAEVDAILIKGMHPETWTQPVAGRTGHAGTGNAVQVLDEALDKALGGLGAVLGDVVVDAVEIGLGRIGDDERAALNDCGPPLVGAAYVKDRVAARGLSSP